MADADDDVSGVSALLAKTSLDRDQSIEVSGKGHELNSAEDGKHIYLSKLIREGSRI